MKDTVFISSASLYLSFIETFGWRNKYVKKEGIELYHEAMNDF